MTFCLKHLIYDHHTLFITLFPDKNLLPKHHFMIHYPRCIRNIVPLVHIWCMRFKAKHFIFFKQSINFFKSLTKTLVKIHQSHVALNWETFNFQRPQYGPVKELNISMFSMLKQPLGVKGYGTAYHIGMHVCSGVECETPVFNFLL